MASRCSAVAHSTRAREARLHGCRAGGHHVLRQAGTHAVLHAAVQARFSCVTQSQSTPASRAMAYQGRARGGAPARLRRRRPPRPAPGRQTRGAPRSGTGARGSPACAALADTMPRAHPARSPAAITAPDALPCNNRAFIHNTHCGCDRKQGCSLLGSGSNLQMPSQHSGRALERCSTGVVRHVNLLSEHREYLMLRQHSVPAMT